MAIKFGEPPEDARREVGATLSRLNRTNRERAVAPGPFESETGGAPTLRFAHRSYALSPDEIMAGRSAAESHPRGWRYVVPQPGGNAIAEVVEEGGRQQVARVTEGPHSRMTRETLEWLSNAPELGDDVYEVRSLAIPALRVDALWLHNEAERGDKFAIVHSLNRQLRPRRIYSEEEFFGGLRQLAGRQSERGTSGG
jgi:hypothetical protein